MTTFTVETDCGTSRDFETRRAAERGRETHVDLCDECGEGDVRIHAGAAGTGTGPADREGGAAPGTGAGSTTGGGAMNGGAAGAATDGGEYPELAGPTFEGSPDSLLSDPLDVLPDYMIDVVEGQPTINKRGYAVIAEHFGIVVQSEAITTAGETDHEYAEFKARAWKKDDGPECAYTGHATARASEDRQGLADNLNEMAETRAMKRAVAWASGLGILAWEELAGQVAEEPTAAP